MSSTTVAQTRKSASENLLNDKVSIYGRGLMMDEDENDEKNENGTRMEHLSHWSEPFGGIFL